MGNNSCCCSNSDPVPTSFDMVNPQQPQGVFLRQLHITSADTASEVEEEALDQGKRDNRRPHDSLRVQLLNATRQDDAPGVLQYVADGADISDMAEALRLAAQRGSASVVRELVAVGLSVNDGCPHSGFTPLQLAAASGHLTVCELLLDALADVHKSIGGATALNLARKMGNMEVEEVLERHVASLVMEDQGEGAEDASQWSRRAHVLPRVSPVLSEAVLQALPSPPSKTDSGPTAAAKKSPRADAPADAPSPEATQSEHVVEAQEAPEGKQPEVAEPAAEPPAENATAAP
mmetsp:Transcript_154891/g.288888  ORF Transcript_154891/g.288888 Transcript_154891/m.288888 type:complete len:291 (-) Transcript_154891:136-1008(-)